ncbi:hypothetical protein [Herpetosiphon gulosus]|uniref:Uncharacterized protein n=1 Tax=Herpetosiphon gulosus TaxID=1973496 RepID=A0ABP9WWV7_9CHLR
MAWELIWMAIGSIGTILLIWWRRSSRSGLPPTPAPQFFTLEHIEAEAQQLSSKMGDNPNFPSNMLPHDGVPDGSQWMQLLVSQPQLAHSLIHQLYLRVYRHGFAMAEIATLRSIVAYHAAHVVITQHDPATLPQPRIWDIYPTQAQWEEIVHMDAERACRLLHDLHLRAAQFGLNVPVMLSESIRVGIRTIQNNHMRT